MRVDQLQELLLKHRPQVVHFSGHGSGDGEIILADGRGEPHAVTPDALAETFRLLRGDLRCVVINACHSQPQAEAIAHHVAGVVGMAAPIEDRAAIAFSTAFYRALAFGEDLQNAFDLARNRASTRISRAANIPQLMPGRADLARVKLATETPPAEWVQSRRRFPTLHLDLPAPAFRAEVGHRLDEPVRSEPRPAVRSVGHLHAAPGGFRHHGPAG